MDVIFCICIIFNISCPVFGSVRRLLSRILITPDHQRFRNFLSFWNRLNMLRYSTEFYRPHSPEYRPHSPDIEVLVLLGPFSLFLPVPLPVLALFPNKEIFDIKYSR